MADITASMVKSLRERSGLPMMDCKQALQETNGDEAAAMELLRKRGAAAAEKKAGRMTGEGRIGAYIDKENGKAALIEMLCETAPVANNPDFDVLCKNIAKQVASTGESDVTKVLASRFVDDESMTITDMINDILNRIRENMQLSRVVFVEGKAATYVHHTGKVGVLIGVEGNGSDEVMNDICMHIAALQPDALTREEMPAEVIEKEKEIAREQIIASGKPENMVDKILTGKMNKFYGERVLLEQAFVKDDKKTVKQVCDEAGFKITCFKRMQVGEKALAE